MGNWECVRFYLDQRRHNFLDTKCGRPKLWKGSAHESITSHIDRRLRHGPFQLPREGSGEKSRRPKRRQHSMYTNPLWRTNKMDRRKQRQTDIAGYVVYDDLAVHRLNRAAK